MTYFNIYYTFRNGEEKVVSDKILERIEKSMEVLKLNKFEKALIKPFMVVGFDIFEAGSTKSKFGCALGLPSNFNYESTKDINKSEILFRNKPINWESDAGKNLEKAIVLTENEQIFAISKSILQFQTQKVLLNSIFPTVSFVMVYSVGTSLNHAMKLFSGPVFVRGIMYTILGMFGIGSWTFMKDFNQVQYDKEIDQKLSELGESMISAGAGYYEKLLLKNIALKELIGDNTYTSKGNINYFIRSKSLPLTARKTFFNEHLNKINAA